MTPLKPRWIFFDIDDTLWDFEANSLVSLSLSYNSSNILRNVFPNEASFIDAYHVINSALWNDFNKGLITTDFLKTERFRKLLFPKIAPEVTTDAQMKVCRDLCAGYLEFLGQQTRLVDNAEETLTLLQPHFCIGALTNGFREIQYRKIYNTNLWKYIQRMVINDETPWHKPEKELYVYAQNAVGASPDEILMVGDNPDTDIRGALNAGWHAILFNKSGNGDITSLPELLPLLGVQ